MKYKILQYFHILENYFHCLEVLVFQKGEILLFMKCDIEKIFWRILHDMLENRGMMNNV